MKSYYMQLRLLEKEMLRWDTHASFCIDDKRNLHGSENLKRQFLWVGWGCGTHLIEFLNREYGCREEEELVRGMLESMWKALE